MLTCWKTALDIETHNNCNMVVLPMHHVYWDVGVLLINITLLWFDVIFRSHLLALINSLIWGSGEDRRTIMLVFQSQYPRCFLLCLGRIHRTAISHPHLPCHIVTISSIITPTINLSTTLQPQLGGQHTNSLPRATTMASILIAAMHIPHRSITTPQHTWYCQACFSCYYVTS